MKKVFLAAIFVSVSFFLTSCGSTNVASTPEASKVPETAQEAVTQKHEEVANDIASEINAVTPKAEESQQEEAESDEEILSEQAEPEPEVTAEDTAKTEEPEDSNVSTAPSESDSTIEANEPESEEADSEAKVESQTESENEQQPEAESQAEPATEPEAAAESESEEQSETSEKVSEEDSNFDKKREQAPTTDEKNKVAEYQIFEEPEIIVHDLPEPQEEPKTEVVEEASNEETKAEESNTEPKEEQSEPQPESTEPSQEEVAQAQPALAEPAQAEKPAEPQPRENIAKSDEVIEEIPVEAEEPVVPSRSVKVKMNQYLDVTYPGTGWTYIGEEDKNDVFNYFGRKLGTKNTTFSLRAKKAGKTILHFYKNDALTGEYIDDYLEVVVEDKKGTGRVKAPSYAEIIPAKPQRRIDRANENAAEKAALPSQEEASQQKQTAPNEAAPATTQEKAAPQDKSAQTKTTNAPAEAKGTKPAVSKEELKKPEQPKEQAPAKSQKKAETAANPKQPKENSAPSKKQSKALPAPKAEKPLPAPPKAVATTPLATQESDIKTVIENKEATTHVKKAEPSQEADDRQAYKYTPPVSSQSVQAEEAPASNEPVVLVEDTTVTPDESLLEKAKKDFEDKKFADALKEAQEYYNTASTRLDEALFLLGQISESNSTVRDIRFAVDSYEMLVKRYPASKYWKQAKNRSIYLKRFYIDIR